MKITFAAGAAPADAAIVLAFASSELSAPAAELDEAAGGALSRAIKASRFEGKPGQSLELLAPAGVDYQRVVLLGVGKLGDLDAGAAEKIGAAAVRAVLLSGAKSACLRFDGTGLEADDCARAGLGAMLAAYRFDAYRSKLSDDKKPSLGALKISVEDAAAPRKSWKRYDAVAQGAAFARDLVSEPANVLYPEEFAKRLVALEKLGLKVDVLNEAEMTKLNMHALLGVGRGSRRQSQLVVMRWEGGDKSTPPLAVVGKGVCFDTGGISLKPGDGMWDMKGDMGGAAAVSGLMMALALKGAKANVVGVVGLVENMPDGDAMRPGDIVTSASGQTIEVLNTDAEGRLVLA
ncbi:MAG: M17 family peptidase N-terminal domain-containing protein, partial [Maricaulaceae bacterium]